MVATGTLSLGIVALIILLVAFRLLVTPIPAIPRLARRFGTRTTAVLCCIGFAAGIVAIAISRR
jgi:hypothetical protein